MKQAQQSANSLNKKSAAQGLGLREYYRTSYSAKVQIFSANGVHITSGRACDISPKGLSVIVNTDNLFIGAMIVLKVSSQDYQETMLLKAKLVYKKEFQSSLENFHVLGFEFQGVSPDLHRRIAMINLKSLSRK